MSRKSVSIVLPRKDAGANGESIAAPVVSTDAGGVDIWVSQDDGVRQDEPAAAAPGALTFAIPDEPDWIDVAQSLLVPQVVFWNWTVSAARKNLAFFL
jgi:hypothetical protein